MEQQEEKRLRKFTEKARQIHMERRDEVFNSLSKIRTDCMDIANQVSENRDNKEYLIEARRLLLDKMNEYHIKNNEYKTYIEANNTDETVEELAILNPLYSELDNMITRTLRFIDDTSKPEAPKSEKGSTHSSGSRRSTTSSRSSRSILMEKVSKMEAAKVRLKMIEEEERLKQKQFQIELKVKEERALSDAKLEQQRSNLESELKVLKHKREVAEAEAEVTAFVKVHGEKRPYSGTFSYSFLAITRDLDTTALEELDLLERYLGPRSKKQASSLRTANAYNERQALVKIWKRLDERYGAPEKVATSLKERLDRFPRISNSELDKLYDLADLLSEILSIKENPHYKMVLSLYDSPAVVNAILAKVPYHIQNKWIDHASKYKAQFSVMFPPFWVFVDFLHGMAMRHNDPSFNFRQQVEVRSDLTNRKKDKQTKSYSSAVTTRKTTVENESAKIFKCPLHEDAKHPLIECRLFLSKSLDEKRDLIKKFGICFKCLKGKHLSKDCVQNIKCQKCESSSHNTIFHIDRKLADKVHGGESKKTDVEVLCTDICGSESGGMKFKGKSCAKTILINVYPEGKPNLKIRTYAIIDDQSNKSLARSEFFEHFNNSDDFELVNYTLRSCAGESTCTGRKAQGYVLESLDGTVTINCPPLIECNRIPSSKQEIATPAVTRQYSHLKDLESIIPEIDENSEVLLLIGRDMLPVHHVTDQRIGRDHEPYAQKLKLGWTIIGESCLGLVHAPESISVYKTTILQNSRESLMEPCQYGFIVKHQYSEDEIFRRTSEDDTPGLSQEDKQFLFIMDNEFSKTSEGKLSAPLPFRQNRPTLPNNYSQARYRAENLKRNLERDRVKQQHFFDFMRKIFSNGHAELAPQLNQGQEVWYLPIFGVYNSKKPSKIRVVFDSSASYEGICLNDILLKGPDLTNNLVGVLLKFRKGQIAATGDIEQMFFFNFEVNHEHRDFLRFIWFQDNDTDKPLVEFRMKVHVFGNTPSPSVANYFLRKAVCDHDLEICDEVCRYVKENFYVDDGLVSGDSPEEIVSLIKKTQDRLMNGGKIRLHKLTSNSAEVLKRFDSKDLAEGVTELNFEQDCTFLQRSLGLTWDVIQDIFTFRVATEDKPFTKRGLLSVINGIFDPIGFVAPVVLNGRIILRRAIQNNSLQWDNLLPSDILSEWQCWKDSLEDLQLLVIPRPYTSTSLNGQNCKLHIFCDASREAIAAVGYICTLENDSKLGFVFGKSKLSPSHGHTIPRLELCAALLGTEIATFIQKQLCIEPRNTYFNTDSQVVLGYIYNETRRCYVYVSNRIDKILKASSRQQWHFVPTDLNPADCGTRPMNASKLQQSMWIRGPDSIHYLRQFNSESFEIIEPESDKELVEVKKSEISSSVLGIHRFERFSSWIRLVKAIAFLKQRLSKYHDVKANSQDSRSSVDFLRESEVLILQEVQLNMFRSELEAIRSGKSISKNSHILDLSPVLDSRGLLCLGGRLSCAKLSVAEQRPIIIPGKIHIATLLTRHFHENVRHQGRHLTEGAIRSNGFWITGGKRLVTSVIRKCVTCKRLRGRAASQKMAELPSDRVNWTPPFTCMAVDCCGPWQIISRRTRGGIAQCKRWAVVFSCLVIRAIHIEVIEDMTSSSFINALRRFIALRGPVSEFRSDQGTNFVGAVNDLGIQTINVEYTPISNFLEKHKIVWKFSPPQASHMNGAIERMIGLSKNILDSILMDHGKKSLTHEVLCTFMAEVCCIVNSRPITAVSSDPTSPAIILTPNVLLTQKVKHSDIDIQMISNFDDLFVKDMYGAQWKQV